MSHGSSEQVRAVALEKYVQPALRAGKTQFAVAVKDLIQDLVSQGFPPGNTPQVCTALRKKEFLREHGIEIEGVDGPPSKMSTTVVVRYRVADSGVRTAIKKNPLAGEPVEPEQEDPSDRAFRLTEKLRGLLKEELAEYGGGEAFLRWIRSEEENAA
jgi:hypothetical protein